MSPMQMSLRRDVRVIGRRISSHCYLLKRDLPTIPSHPNYLGSLRPTQMTLTDLGGLEIGVFFVDIATESKVGHFDNHVGSQ